MTLTMLVRTKPFVQEGDKGMLASGESRSRGRTLPSTEPTHDHMEGINSLNIVQGDLVDPCYVYTASSRDVLPTTRDDECIC